MADREYFQSAKNGESLFVGPAIRTKAGDQIVSTFSRPIRGKNGEFLGVVVVSLEIKRLTDFYDLMEFDLNPLIGVYRRDGNVVARRPELEKFLGGSILGGPLFQELAIAPSGVFQSVSQLDGKRRLAAYRTVEDYDLIVVTGIENEKAMASWRERSYRFVAVGGFSALLIAVAIAFGFRASSRERKANLAMVNAIIVAKQKAAELGQARHDALTGLPARGLWSEMAEATRKQCQTEDLRMAVLLLDLDGFKAVNDTFGHERGDQVLRKTADILRDTLRENDMPGRLGGDEFVVCVIGPKDVIQERVAKIAQRLVDGMAQIGDGVGCSIGVAVCPTACEDMDCALRKADEAMYEAKRQGKNQFVLWGVPKADGSEWKLENQNYESAKRLAV